MAKAYVAWLKSRSKPRHHPERSKNPRCKKALLSELWERIEGETGESFGRGDRQAESWSSPTTRSRSSPSCARFRDQKNIMAENQKILEDMTLEANEVEHRASVEREKDMDCTMGQGHRNWSAEGCAKLMHRLSRNGR